MSAEHTNWCSSNELALCSGCSVKKGWDRNGVTGEPTTCRDGIPHEWDPLPCNCGPNDKRKGDRRITPAPSVRSSMRLRFGRKLAEVERLREALEEVVDTYHRSPEGTGNVLRVGCRMRDIARKALASQPAAGGEDEVPLCLCGHTRLEHSNRGSQRCLVCRCGGGYSSTVHTSVKEADGCEGLREAYEGWAVEDCYGIQYFGTDKEKVKHKGDLLALQHNDWEVYLRRITVTVHEQAALPDQERTAESATVEVVDGGIGAPFKLTTRRANPK